MVELRAQVDSNINTIDQEIDNRTQLLEAAAETNNRQDAALSELDTRLELVSENIGILEFSGQYTYVLEKRRKLLAMLLILRAYKKLVPIQ